MLQALKNDLAKLSDKQRAKNCLRFFKTGQGEYGQGDKFLGIKAPEQRKIAKKYSDLRPADIQKLLNSQIHEHRQIGLFILIRQYQKAGQKLKKEIVEFYLKNLKRVNNWDLVDCSAPYILGDYLLDKDRAILYQLAKSDNLWEKRIAVLASFVFIRQNDFQDTLKIARLLLNDQHDLIHKAVGWMLREIGKRDRKTEEEFLKKYYRQMPRTMLRYAIEKFEESERKAYLTNKVRNRTKMTPVN